MELSIDAGVADGVRMEMSEQETMEGVDWEKKCYI